jgi:predicted amidohydrolase
MKITSIQMNSTNDKDINLTSASDLAEAAIRGRQAGPDRLS